MLFKPKKKRKNGIDWTREPSNGLKSVVLAALGWGIILMAFQTPAVALLAWLLATLMLCIAFGIGLRGLKKKKKADRMPSYIGILLGSPAALALALFGISVMLSVLFTIFSIPIFFLLLLFGL